MLFFSKLTKRALLVSCISFLLGAPSLQAISPLEEPVPSKQEEELPQTKRSLILKKQHLPSKKELKENRPSKRHSARREKRDSKLSKRVETTLTVTYHPYKNAVSPEFVSGKWRLYVVAPDGTITKGPEEDLTGEVNEDHSITLKGKLLAGIYSIVAHIDSINPNPNDEIFDLVDKLIVTNSASGEEANYGWLTIKLVPFRTNSIFPSFYFPLTVR
jgi:hypothetical protein